MILARKGQGILFYSTLSSVQQILANFQPIRETIYVHSVVAPVVQVVNLEFYLFESWVGAPGGSDFDFIFKNKKKGFNC